MLPFEAEGGQWQRREKWRAHPQRMDRRTDVVQEARERDFLRSGSSTDRLLGLDQESLAPVTLEFDRRRESVAALWWLATDVLGIVGAA